MLILGEQKTIDQLVEIENELIRDAKRYEELARNHREQADKIHELIRANMTISDLKDVLRWAEQKAVGMNLFKQEKMLEIKQCDT